MRFELAAGLSCQRGEIGVCRLSLRGNHRTGVACYDPVLRVHSILLLPSLPVPPQIVTGERPQRGFLRPPVVGEECPQVRCPAAAALSCAGSALQQVSSGLPKREANSPSLGGFRFQPNLLQSPHPTNPDAGQH